MNGRFLDLALRLPDELRALEPALRDLLTGAFRRGKIELRLNARHEGESAWPNPQPEQLNRLLRLESTVQGWLPKAQGRRGRPGHPGPVPAHGGQGRAGFSAVPMAGVNTKAAGLT